MSTWICFLQLTMMVLRKRGATRPRIEANCRFVAVKFRSPRHQGESISHIWEAWQPSRCKHEIKGGKAELERRIPSNRIGYGYERNLCLNCRNVENMRNELIRISRGKKRLIVPLISLMLLRPPADSRNLSPMRNGTTERGNYCKSSREIEKLASRKPYNGGIVQEANAHSNV